MVQPSSDGILCLISNSETKKKWGLAFRSERSLRYDLAQLIQVQA